MNYSQKIGDMVYNITIKDSETATETIIEKVEKLINSECEKAIWAKRSGLKQTELDLRADGGK